MSIKLEQVKYTYSPKTPYEQVALKGVSLEIEKGEFVALIGHTGSGKSTLIQIMNGLLTPTEGVALVNRQNLAGKGAAVKSARSQVGMVFQYPEHQLFAETVYEDIAFGPRNKGFDEDVVEHLVRQAMEFVDLDYDTYAHRSPFQLSGGQMRRVAIAGVAALDPEYLILDEPSAGLDPVSRDNIFARLLGLYKKRGLAVILVTHSMEEAVRYANRLVVINGGQIVLDGRPEDIFLHHRRELLASSMDEPQVYKILAGLRSRGLQLPGSIKDGASLLAALEKAKGLTPRKTQGQKGEQAHAQ